MCARNQMLYSEEPEKFVSKFSIGSCFIEYDGKILLLFRKDDKFEGNTWAIPAGKISDDESIQEGLIREIKEETSIELIRHH